MAKCYVCDLRPATTRDAAGVPLCERCAKDVGATVGVEAAKVDKAPPDAVKVAARVAPTGRTDVAYCEGRPLFVAAWRAGGCVLCGGTTRDVGAEFAHSGCWAKSSRTIKKFVLDHTRSPDWRQ